jgi:hypothetical protein
MAEKALEQLQSCEQKGRDFCISFLLKKIQSLSKLLFSANPFTAHLLAEPKAVSRKHVPNEFDLCIICITKNISAKH